VNRGPFLVIDQWLVGSGSLSVRVFRTVAVWMCFAVRDEYLINSFVVVDRGPCLVLEHWLCGSASRVVIGT
jgi:hypothetical protein